ncbi:MAG: ATP-binding protein [Melioribacteraceae bacterium]
MKDIIKTIIKDFHQSELPNFKERNLTIPLNSNKIISIIGSRRTGKTYYLYQIISELLKTVDKENILYINFEDERLNLKSEDLRLIIDAYYELYPEKKDSLYIFFDEVQTIPNWEKFVRRLYDTVTKNIIITGSSSKLLSKEIASSLRGRAIWYELFPLSFSEYLHFLNIDSSDIYSSRNKAKIIKAFSNYLYNGGFPEVVFYDSQLRLKTLQTYLDVMIYRDIIEKYDVKNSLSLRYFIRKCLSNISNTISVNKLFNELKSLGIKISKDTIYDYINYVNDCYLLFIVSIYSESINVQQTNEKKLYCIDTGLVNSVSFKFSQNTGRMLENVVFMQLRSKGEQVYYHKKKAECDFLVHKDDKICAAYQVTTEINKSNWDREVKGLLEALDIYQLNEGYILTLDQSNDYKEEGKSIKVRPVWKWILGFEG